ncbi:STAS domain-containing protein [Deltaproteobacteria bacterium TL4]
MIRLSHHMRDGICIIAVEGNIIGKDSINFQNYTIPFVKNRDIQGIVINLEHSAFMDSSGIGIVAKLLSSLRTRNAKLVLCGLNEKFNEILDIVGLKPLFNICSTEEDAINHILIAIELGGG